jgi:hypothetical protein
MSDYTQMGTNLGLDLKAHDALLSSREKYARHLSVTGKRP